ncbi:MAG: hypothetical protein ACJ0BT_02250 [Pseudohongiellaceae bacterium]
MSEVSSNVGSKKIFENDKIIVWDFELQPGETTPMHKHENSYIWYALQGGPLDCDDEHGNDLGVFDVPTGSVFDIKLKDGELEVMSEIAKGAKIPSTHNAKNIGDTPYREILIEFKE